MINQVQRGLTRIADQFRTNRTLTPELRNMQVSMNNRVAGEEKVLKTIGTKNSRYSKRYN